MELKAHVFEAYGFMAGTDEASLADLDDAIRDPGVRAIFTTRGGRVPTGSRPGCLSWP